MPRPTTDELVNWVDQITRRGVNLTSWEIEFVESMEIRIGLYGERTKFSDNEAAKIENIYSDRVP